MMAIKVNGLLIENKIAIANGAILLRCKFYPSFSLH